MTQKFYSWVKAKKKKQNKTIIQKIICTPIFMAALLKDEWKEK